MLVADDQASVRLWLENLLSGWGYQVVCAADGREALGILRQSDGPSLAIVDWVMPIMDGTEVCRQVRSMPGPSYIYILLLTSKSEQADMIEGLGSGADDYLKKPFDPLELKARLEVASRIAVEKTLRDNEQRFQAAATLASAGLAVADLQGRLLEVNDGFCQFLGYSREDLLRKTVFDICHPDDLAGTRIRFARFNLGNASFSLERRYVHRSGGTVWALLSVSYVRHGDGTADYVVAQTQDITARKLAEEGLRRSEALFRAITENAAELIRVLERDGMIRYVSPSHEPVLGYSARELQGINCLDELVYAEDRPAARRWTQGLVETGRAEPTQFRYVHKNGSIRMLDCSGGVIRNGQGEVEALVVTSRDMTERKLLESRLQQAQKLEALGQLAAGIAHEINTPAQYVLDNTMFIQRAWGEASRLVTAAREILAGSAPGAMAEFDRVWQENDFPYLSQEVPRALEESLTGLQRLARTVQAMKEFSCSCPQQKEPLDLNRAIETVIAVSRNEWKYVAELETRLDKSLPPVPCLASEFNQAILSILINSVQAIAEKVKGKPGEKGLIRVMTQRRDPWAEISIQDSGVGVAECIRDKIFEPFFTTKEVGSGTGQGLTITHSVIVQKHGGQMWFESEPGEGTTFIIRLPLQSKG